MLLSTTVVALSRGAWKALRECFTHHHHHQDPWVEGPLESNACTGFHTYFFFTNGVSAPSVRPSRFSLKESSRLITGSDIHMWYQKRRCRPRLPAFSEVLLSLSTSRSALCSTSARTFTTDGIASAGTPLLTVATPSPRWGVSRTLRGRALLQYIYITSAFIVAHLLNLMNPLNRLL